MERNKGMRMNDDDIHMMIHMIKCRVTVLSLLLLLSSLPQSQCQLPDKPNNYTLCREESYNCGTLTNISYPFWGQNRRSFFCGGGFVFGLRCDDNKNTTTIQIESEEFTVDYIDNTSYTMSIVPIELDACSPRFFETSFSSFTPFMHPDSVSYITIFFNCPSHIGDGNFFNCNGGGGGAGAGGDNNKNNVSYYWGAEDKVLTEIPSLRNCGKRIQVPTGAAPPPPGRGGAGALREAVGEGFDVKYDVSEECRKCFESGGVCGTNETSYDFNCYCSDGSTALYCPVSAHKPSKLIRKWGLIAGTIGVGAAGLTICITYFCLRGKSQTWHLGTKNNKDIEAFLRNHGALEQKRYKFSEVKKMTNSFKVKLGQGGFGAVYKGELLTGSSVAVKILNESKGRNEDFINEVASISRTSHVNVVTLVGFCLEGHKKALIYEFMPNGSLEKFIQKKGPEIIASLSWEKLYQIATGIARGLEYLHRGCNTRILHFDIKPHNILLDENFCPKISDFGLAKLCLKKESIISMSDPRGTPGYVAPEMWNRRFGGVSHKSDVYSYGMILLDIVEGRKNTNFNNVSRTSEIYFPDTIYKRLEQGNLRSDGAMNTEENEMAKRMTMVGLWCIQTFPDDRPTMSRVIEMLEGSTNSLEVPPKPTLSSPTRSRAEPSTSSSSH